MGKRKIIFDCDIGCDDAVALISLLLCKDLEVTAITCVRGNIPVDDVVLNALKVSHLCGKDIPVYKGCSQAMVRTLLKGRDCNTLMETIHMEIDGKEILIHDRSFDLPLPDRTVEKEHACSYLVNTLRDTKEKLNIVAVGPLTNIAMALRLDPDIVRNIDTIYIMGGGLYIGNRTPVAEANFYDDPEAAEIVLNCGAHCVVFPIEACEMGAGYTRSDLDDLEKTGNLIGRFLKEELEGYIDRCNILFKGDENSCCVYDYAAAGMLIDESVVIEKKLEIVHVDVSGGMSDGQMVVDRRGMFKQDLPVEVVYQMDTEKLHRILLDELRQI